MGTLQATEVIKLLLGVGKPLLGRMLLYDALELSFREVRLKPDPECDLCGEHPTLTDLSMDFFQMEEEPGEGADELTPEALLQRLKQVPAPILLDVREPMEWEIARLPSAQLMPLSELDPEHLPYEHEAEIILYCHRGVRSRMALDALKQAGFRHLKNLAGGIDRWSVDVDPTVPRY